MSEDTVSTLEIHHAFRQQFRAELAGSLKHEKATGWLSRRSKGENSLLSRIVVPNEIAAEIAAAITDHSIYFGICFCMLCAGYSGLSSFFFGLVARFCLL